MSKTKKKKRNGQKVRRIPLSELWARENGICCLCGNPVSMIEATREHKLSRSNGGKDGKNYRNVGLAHRSCNLAKGSETWHIFNTR